MVKARGVVTPQGREEALQRAKQRSYCSACGKNGHWHKDPICHKKKANGSPGQTTHTTHIVYYTGGETTELEVIIDCACSRTLAGVPWVKNYIVYAKKNQIPYMIMDQSETFKFGGPRLYPSSKALVAWLSIRDCWFLVKIAVVSTQVPLLLSRPVSPGVVSAGHPFQDG